MSLIRFLLVRFSRFYLGILCLSTTIALAQECPCVAPVNISATVPTVDNYDSSASCQLDGLDCAVACSVSGTWLNIPNGNKTINDKLDWIVRGGTTPTERTGPSTDASGSGKYLYLESSCVDIGHPKKEAILQSKCLNFKNVISPELRFAYHLFGEETGDVHIEASTDNCLSWQEVTSINGPQQTTSDDSWKTKTVGLGAFRNLGNVRLRFRGVTGRDQFSDMAIDGIELRQAPSKDIAIQDIIEPSTGCGLTGLQRVTVLLENLGYNDQTGFQVKYQIDGGATVTETFNGSLPAGSQIFYSFNTKANFSVGKHAVTAAAALTGDERTANDTFFKSIEHIPTITSYPYSQTFESGSGGWISEGKNNTWAFGKPQKTVIKGAASGDNAWVTGGLDISQYRNDEVSSVVGPCFDFSSMKFPVVGLKSWWNAEGAYDGAVLQSTVNNGQTWQRIGNFGDPNNWYTSNIIAGNPGGQSTGWSGSITDRGGGGSGGWVQSGNFLAGLGAKPTVRLRIAFASDNVIRDDGFAFDDFTVREGLTATKTVALTLDKNANKFADPGDELEYTILITSTSFRTINSVIIDDTPDSGTSLKVGSVTTTRGTIALGNSTGNTTVRINNISTFAPGATITIKFKVIVKATASAQICNQANVTSNSFTGNFPTDNPALSGKFDSTCVSCPDSDGDGASDCVDSCPQDPNKSVPGTCGCGVADTDSDNDGTPNCNDQCPNDPKKTQPQACGCGNLETDSDSDGTPNCNDQCINDPNKTAPGTCGCGTADTDSDNDETPNCNDQCANDPNKTTPGTCGCNVADTDSDNDGTPNCNDQCPNDAKKTQPGQCGCGALETDSDGDGTANCNDQCVNDPNKTKPGECGCGVSDVDSDSDGIPNCRDTCPDGSNVDTDNDGVPDCIDGCPQDRNKTQPGVCGCGVADSDSDSDGVPNCIDTCPNDPNKTKPGQCGCGVVDTDSDSDGTANCNDQCPNDPKKTLPGQCACGVVDTDTDNDGTANCKDLCPNDAKKIAPGQCGCGVVDTDSDNDGTANCNDQCPNDSKKTKRGVCGCGVADTDSDNDGTPNCNDKCPNDSKKTQPGQCGCGVVDTDTDRDGTANCNDKCPNDPKKTQPGQCGCGVLDTDSDSDGTANCIDQCAADPNKISPGFCGCGELETDGDGDGAPNCVDQCPTDPLKAAPLVCGCGIPDTDSDSDGTLDCQDACPQDGGKTTAGVCGCGTPDIDSDGDNVSDCEEQCPNDINKQIPGACGCGRSEADTDNDGAADCVDQCPSDVSKVAAGSCGCGRSEIDTDKDKVPDCADQCPTTALKTDAGICGCSVLEQDTNANGIMDCLVSQDLRAQLNSLNALIKKVKIIPEKKSAPQKLLRKTISRSVSSLKGFVATNEGQIILVNKSKPINKLISPVSKTVNSVVKAKSASILKSSKSKARKAISTIQRSLG